MIQAEVPKGYCQCGCGGKTNLNKISRVHLGYKRGDPFKYIIGHDKKIVGGADYIETETGCWEWRKSKDASGYGRISPAEFGTRLAHRVIYMRKFGFIPKTVFLCHTCDNPCCVNPAHMFEGTQKDNIADCAKKLRTWSHTHPELIRRGEDNNTSKLNDVAVRVIRYMHGAGKTQAQISRAYKVSISAIHLIIKGKSWRHV